MTDESGGRLWIRLIKGHRVERSLVLPCGADEAEGVLQEAMYKMDMSRPMWLSRHRADWEKFGMTRFLPEHFMEPVAFDRMEISYIRPEAGKGSK